MIAEQLMNLPVVCFDGVYRTWPVSPGVTHGYAVYKDGQPFRGALPPTLATTTLMWGGYGTGTQALAFALLADAFGTAVAGHYADTFRDAVIAPLPLPYERGLVPATEHHLWHLTSDDVRAWMDTITPPASISVDVPPDAWEWIGQHTRTAQVATEFYPGRRVLARVMYEPADPRAALHVEVLAVQRWRIGQNVGGWEAEPQNTGPVPKVQWHSTG